MPRAFALAELSVDERVAQVGAWRCRGEEVVEQLVADLHGRREEGRRAAGRVAEVAVAGINCCLRPQSIAFIDEAVPRRDVPRFVLHVAEPIVVGVAVGQEGLRRGARVLPFLRMMRLDIDKVIALLVVRHQVGINADQLVAAQLAGPVGLPSVAPDQVERAFVVQVVGLGKEAYVRPLVAPHGKEACQVGRLVLPKSRSALDVCYPAHHVFALQPHVDDVVLTALVGPPEPLILLGLLVIDGHVLHRVGRQVLEHELPTAFEEVLAVQQEVVHELAVVVDAPVALEFDARQLTEQGVEHRAFRQLELAGIIYHGVAPEVESDARCLDGHLLQGLRNLMNIEGRDVARRFPSAHTVHLIAKASSPIVVHRNAEDVVAGQSGDLYAVARHVVVHFLAAPVVVEGGLSGTDRVDERAVFGQKFHLRVHQVLTRPGIADHAGEPDGARLVARVVLHKNLFLLDFHLDGLSLTESFDGLRHRETIEADVDGKGLEVVGDEVDGVFRLHVAQSGECVGERFASEGQVASHGAEAETYIYNNV